MPGSSAAKSPKAPSKVQLRAFFMGTLFLWPWPGFNILNAFRECLGELYGPHCDLTGNDGCYREIIPKWQPN